MNAPEVLKAVKEQRYFDRKDYAGARSFIRMHPEAFTHLPSTINSIDGAFEIADGRRNGGQRIHDAATVGAVGAAYETLEKALSGINSGYATFDSDIRRELGKLDKPIRDLTSYIPRMGEIARHLTEPVEAELTEQRARAGVVLSEMELARLYILAGLIERGQVEVARKIGVLE